MPYELKIYQRTAEKLAPPEFKALSPLGTSPTITIAIAGDDDGATAATTADAGNKNSLALSESNAIMEYILDEAAAKSMDKNLRPGPGTKERIPFLFWFHTSAGSFQTLMSIDTLFQLIPKRLPWPLNHILKSVATKVNQSFLQPRLEAILKLAENTLGGEKGDPFLAGAHLTAADITIIYSFDAAFNRMPDLHTQYPACHAWLERMLERPALQRALKKVNQESISFKDF